VFRIFLSYRRDDSSGYAGRLYDGLTSGPAGDGVFAERQIFMDIDTIEPGVDFRRVLIEALSSCSVVLALVGKHWVNAVDEHGHRRLDKPNDFVRLELEQALERSIPIVPLLVQNARMPSESELPQSLEDFASRNAFELSDTRWRYDLEKLLTWLKRQEQQSEEFRAFARDAVSKADPEFFDPARRAADIMRDLNEDS
jgi:hypothetical protein